MGLSIQGPMGTTIFPYDNGNSTSWLMFARHGGRFSPLKIFGCSWHGLRFFDLKTKSWVRCFFRMGPPPPQPTQKKASNWKPGKMVLLFGHLAGYLSWWDSVETCQGWIGYQHVFCLNVSLFVHPYLWGTTLKTSTLLGDMISFWLIIFNWLETIN